MTAVGDIEVDGVALSARDGAAIRDVTRFTVTARTDAEVVLVDTAP